MAKKEQVRARDSDRVEICAIVDAALADGQLSADEHATRTRSAMRAKFTADLDRIVRDLQVPGELAGAAILTGDRPARRWWVPVAVLAVAAALGAGAGSVAQDEPPPGAAAAAEAEPESAPLPDLLTADGLRFFIDAYRREFGDTVIDTVSVHPELVLVQRLERGSPRNFHFDEDGFGEVGVAVPSNAAGRPIDLADIDLMTLAAILAGAPASVRSEQGAVEHLRIGFEPIAPADAGPVIQIFVEGPGGKSGHLSVSFAGVPLEVFPAR